MDLCLLSTQVNAWHIISKLYIHARWIDWITVVNLLLIDICFVVLG